MFRDEIRKACEQATPGPWWADGDYEWCVYHNDGCLAAGAWEKDADFIAGAREWVPALLAENDELRAALRMVREYHTLGGVPLTTADQRARRIVAQACGSDGEAVDMAAALLVEHDARVAAEQERDEAIAAGDRFLDEKKATEVLRWDAEARVVTLEAALRTYGEHHTTCDAWPYEEWAPDSGLGRCTCGLDAALGDEGQTTDA